MKPVAPRTAPRLRDWLAGLVEIDRLDDRSLSGLCSDSRAVTPGAAFLALPGLKSHGLDFLEQALAAGAAAVLWPSSAASDAAHRRRCRQGGAVGVALPAMPGAGLGELVSRFYQHPSREMAVVGVTGTDGKTSVTHMIAAALEHCGRPAGLIGTLGWGRGADWHTGSHTTPDLVSVHGGLAALRDLGCETVAMEVSSHGLDQGRVDGVRFRVAVLTNLGRDHLDYHGTPQAYKAAKRRLFELPDLSALVLNLDDDFGRELSGQAGAAREVWTYGQAEDARLRLLDLQCLPQGLALRLATPQGEVALESGLLGRFNAANLCAALATLLALEIPMQQALDGLAAMPAVPGRMEAFRAAGQAPLVVDYAHTPQALTAALGAMREHFGGDLVCVFGCGGNRDRGKRPLMGEAAERLADRVVVTDDNPRDEAPEDIAAEILAGMREPQAAEVIHDRRRAIAHASRLVGASGAVLVAGKGHETTQLRQGVSRHFSDRELAVELCAGGAHA